MTERILALHRMDLALADQLSQQLAGQTGRPAPLVTVFDPVLLTHAYSLGLSTVRLLPTPDCDIELGGTARALAGTRLLQAALDPLLAELVPEAPGTVWCGRWLVQLQLTALGYARIARAMAPALADGPVHVLLPELPHRYGFHSFVPGLVLSDELRRAGLAVQLYSSPLPPWDEPLLPDPASAADGPVDLLCHLPTCFADAGLFADEIRASGRAALNLPAQLFDAPLDGVPRSAQATPQQLAERLAPAQQARLASVLDRAGQLLSQQLAPLLPGSRLAQVQVEALVEGLRHNALLYFALCERFDARPPATLLLSNHDTGLHGALLSFARRHGLRTLLVPHAKIFNEVVTSTGHDPLCLTHPLQGGEVADLDGARLPRAALDFGEAWQLPATPCRPLATLGLVLNSVAANAMCVVDLRVYLDGLRRLLAWCQAQGIECRVRCRPNGSSLALLCAQLGLSLEDLMQHQAGSITDFGAGCDLVLGYDVPTSGVFELLRHGTPVLQALCRRLAPHEARIVDSGTVPQLGLDEVVARLDGLRADPLQLWRFAREQRSRYLAASAQALPLRHWL